MRGIIFSAMGVAMLTALTMVAVLAMEYAKNAVPINKTLLESRISAAYYHIKWEYEGVGEDPTNIDVSKGCVPFIALDTQSDPIQTLATPHIANVCGG